MAKYPAAGRVKTRLAAAIGAEAAGALSRAFVLDLHDRVRAAGWDPTWAYWPADAPFGALLPGAHCVPQRGRDLGERMASVAGDALRAGAGAVVLVGADVPHVDAAALAEARAALADGTDVVVGPARDGGYYLLGLHRVEAVLFEDIPWGTADVRAVTLARAGAAGLRVRLLREGFDVDDATDLADLRTLVETGAVALPRTAAVLAGLPPSSP